MNNDFDKKLMFNNILFLLKKSEIKIGELESDCGVSPGYISRTSKDGNTKPGIEFIFKVAQKLNVSIDTLLKVDMTKLSPTEQYLLSFLEKLKKDTIKNKLDWNCEKKDYLDRVEVDNCGCVGHPLFSYETFYEKGEIDYPEEVSRVVFISNSFECHTAINDDCFNLRLKNGLMLYLMNISKSVYKINDSDAFAKEIWMSDLNNEKQCICSNKENSSLAKYVDDLYNVIKEYFKHPRIKNDFKNSIDAFMKDDWEDDNKFDLPF